MRKIIILTCAFFIAACIKEEDSTIPEDILSHEKMQGILIDVHLSEALAGIEFVKSDTIHQVMPQYYIQIFKKHSITKEDFFRSFDYYSEHPAELDEIYEEVLEEIARQESEHQANE